MKTEILDIFKLMDATKLDAIETNKVRFTLENGNYIDIENDGKGLHIRKHSQGEDYQVIVLGKASNAIEVR